MRSVVADSKLALYQDEYFYQKETKPRYTYSKQVNSTPHTWRRSDIVTIDFKDGFRAPTAYYSTSTVNSLTHVESEFTKGSWTYKGKYDLRGSDLGRPSLPTMDSKLQSLLIMSALAKVKDEKVNLAVTLAEMGQTIEMIAKHFIKLRQSYSAARRGNWKRAYDILGIGRSYKQGRRDLASGWLEMIYGWLPLLSDVYGAVDELNRRVNTRGYTIVGRARREESGSTPTTTRFYQWASDYTIDCSWSYRNVQKVSLWYRLDFPSLQRAAAVGVTNPALLAWELTPLSFLVDWVASIGDWLSSLDATIGLKFMGATHTFYYFQGLQNAEIKFRSVSGKVSKKLGSHLREGMDRSVISDSPDDKLVFTNPFSMSHAITASALLITSLKTR